MDSKNKIDYYTSIIEANRNDAEAYKNRGNAFYELLEYEEAISDYAKAIELNPNYAAAYINRGAAYYELLEYEKAISDYTKAIELNHDFAKAYSNRGCPYYELLDYERAISDFTKAIELNPIDADAYINRGIAFAELLDYKKAIGDFTKAIVLNPKDAVAYYNRGNAYAELLDYKKAIGDFAKAIDLNPDYAAAYNNRGIVYRKFQKYEVAISDYAKAIELNPINADAYINRGIAYYELQKYEEAISDCTKAIELNPIDADAYNNRGIAYTELLDYKKAIGDFTKAIELNPDYAAAHNNRGSAYYELQDYERAISDYTKAIELDSQLAAPWFAVARISIKKGNYREAQPCLLRFYHLAKAGEFFKVADVFLAYFSEHPAPIFIYRVFEENPVLYTMLSLKEQIDTVYNEVTEILLAIEYIKSSECTFDNIEKYKLEGVITYYAGDPIISKKLFDKIDDIEESDLMGQFYLIMSQIGYNDDYSGELETALKQAEGVVNGNKDNIQLYYAGHLYYLAGKHDSALRCFELSKEFLPSKYMEWLMLYKLDRHDEKDKLIKEIIEIEESNKEKGHVGFSSDEVYEINLLNKNWNETIKLNAHISELFETKQIIFDWLEEIKQSDIDTYKKAISVFTQTTEQEKRAFIIWKTAQESAAKLNDFRDSLSVNGIQEICNDLTEKFGDDFSRLNKIQVSANNLEDELALYMESKTINKNDIKNYLLLISCFFHKNRLTQQQLIFLTLFVVVKEKFDGKINLHIFQNIFEHSIPEAIYYTAHAAGLIPPYLSPEERVVLHGVAYQVIKNFLKQKLPIKQEETGRLFYHDFKSSFLEYISELESQEVEDFFGGLK